MLFGLRVLNSLNGIITLILNRPMSVNVQFTPIDLGKFLSFYGIGRSVTFLEDVQGLTPKDIGIILLPADEDKLVNLSIPTQGDRVVDVPLKYITPLAPSTRSEELNAIRLTISEDCEESVYLPLEDNIRKASVEVYDEDDELDLMASALALIEKWENEKWGYYGTATVEVGNITGVDFGSVEVDSEFYVIGFSAEMVEVEMYDRPFEGAVFRKFISDFSWRCFKGEVYSKDFGYQECPRCGRTICVQNPSNGWMTHFREVDDDEICLKCFEELKFGEGITDAEIESGELKGMFYSNVELEEHGFTFHSNHYVQGSDHARRVLAEAKALKEDNYIVFLGYDALAIGGLEGHISLFKKLKPIDKEE